MTGHGLVRLSGIATLLILFMGTGHTEPSQLTLISPNAKKGALFGITVHRVGDVDQDGLADVVVGTVGEQRAYVFSGADGSVLLELMSPNEEPSGAFGHSVAPAGDVDHDGFPDVLVGAYREDPGTSPLDAGRAYTFSGRDGGLLFELKSPNEERAGRFGETVSGAGDVNQDGFPDAFVSAEREDPGQSPVDAGRGYVFSGRDGRLLFQLKSPNQQAHGNFSRGASEAGDVNRDGFPDVVVGAKKESPGGSPEEAGRVYVFSGRDGTSLLELKSPHEVEDGYFGYSVGAGDVDQDGSSDVIVGAENEGSGNGLPRAGRAYVFSGQDGSLLLELKSPNEEEGGGFGGWVANAGDVDQDAHPDVIVGAWRELRRRTGGEPTEPRYGAGRAYVFSGQDGHLLLQLNSPNQELGGIFGNSVAGAGDCNGDGVPDVVVGAALEDPGASPIDAGRAYIFFLTPIETDR